MNRLEEFWYSVAPQEDLPLYKEELIGSKSCENLIKIIEIYKTILPKHKSPEDTIKCIIIDEPDYISDLRVFVGISDKRLYLDLTYIANFYTDDSGKRLVNESREHLIKHDTKFFIRQLKSSPLKYVWAEQITAYFISHGLVDILNTFLSLSKQQIVPIFNNLIAPKEIQQMQAKYRGHGAEQAFAKVVNSVGLHFIPKEKDTDPMGGYDPNVNLASMTQMSRNASNEDCHSFDLLITDNDGNIRVLIQSLIHSSDPGQYGVNKSDETIDIKKRIKKYNKSVPSSKHVYLLGSVDGVGFSENPNGTIAKMLDWFDDFFQMHTLFKIPLFLQKIGMIDNILGIIFDNKYFDKIAIEHFKTKYMDPANALVLDEIPYGNESFIAGKATVVMK